MTLVDLYSDTQTRPTAAMRAGDRRRRGRRRAARRGPDDDARSRSASPSCSARRPRSSCPRGTMCNEIAIRAARRARRRARCFLGDRAPPARVPRPAARRARRARCMTVVDGDARRVHAARRSRRRDRRPSGDRYRPRSRLVSASSSRRTSPAGGSGRCERCARCSRSPREHGLRTHLDGARLLNAVVATGDRAGRVGGRLRHRVDRLHQGPRGAASARAWPRAAR